MFCLVDHTTGGFMHNILSIVTKDVWLIKKQKCTYLHVKLICPHRMVSLLFTSHLSFNFYVL